MRHRSADRFRGIVSPVTDAQTYRNLLYLLLAIPLGIAYQFGLMLGFFGGLVLVLAVVGVPILLAAIVGSRLVADLERRLANALLTTEIPPADDVPSPADDGLWATGKALVSSQSTWKGIGFLVLKSFLGVLMLFFMIIAGFGSLGLVLAPLSESTVVLDWTIETRTESLLAVPLGIALALASVHVLNWVARITESLATALLSTESADSSH